MIKDSLIYLVKLYELYVDNLNREKTKSVWVVLNFKLRTSKIKNASLLLLSIVSVYSLLASNALAQTYAPKEITKEQLEKLPNYGSSTCTYMHFKRKNAPSAHTCKATLLSSSQMIVSPNCIFPKESRSSVKLSCLGSTFVLDIDSALNPRKLESGLNLIDLPKEIDVIPPKMATEEDSKEILQDISRCRVTTDTGLVPLNPTYQVDTQLRPYQIKNLADIKLTDASIGGSLVCVDEAGEAKTLGIIDHNLQIIPSWLIDPNLERHTRARNIKIEPNLSVTDETQRLCEEVGECLGVLSNESRKLTANIAPMLTQLNDQFSAQKKVVAQKSTQVTEQDQWETELLKFQDLFKESIQACHQEQNRIHLSSARRPESSISSSLFGGLSNVIASNFYDNDDLAKAVVESAEDKDTERLLGTRAEILAKVKRSLDHSQTLGLNETERVSQAALEIARDTITQTLIKDYNMDPNDPRLQAVLVEGMGDFKECLKNAKNAYYDIPSCVKKFKEHVPTVIGKTILSMNLDEKFKSSYKENQGDYIKLTQHSNQVYDRCISSHFFSGSNKDVSPNQRTVACVYSSVLGAFDQTANHTLNDLMTKFHPNDRERRKVVADIRLQSLNTCPLSQTMVDVQRLNNEQFQSLSRMDQKDLEKSILQCKDAFSLTAAPIVFENTLKINKEFNEAFTHPDDKKQAIAQLREQFFDPCVALVKSLSPLGQLEPTKCEGIVTTEATFMVTNKIMEKSIQDQLDNLHAMNPEMSEREKGMEILALKLETQKAMAECRKDLQAVHFAAIRNTAEPPTENDIIQCLSQGIRLIAERVAEKTISTQIQGDPDLSKLAGAVKNHPQLRTLAKETGDCFELKINTIQNISELSAGIENTQTNCVLQTEKRATVAIGGLLINEKLKPIIQDDKERAVFIEKFIEDEGGLRDRLNNATHKAQLDFIVSGIQTDITMAYAKDFVPSSIANYLNGSLPNAEKVTGELSEIVLKDLETCATRAGRITDSERKSKSYDQCNKLALGQATELVAAKLVHHNIDSNITDAKEVKRISDISNKRLGECLAKVKQQSYELSSDDFEKQTNSCVANEVFNISREVPKVVLTSVSSLAGSKLSSANLEKELKKVDDFYYGGQSKVTISKDPIVQTYQALASCLVSKEYDFKQKNQGIEEALKISSECTDTLRGQVEFTVKSNFLASKFPGQKAEHGPALNKTIDILMLLQGKEDPNAPSGNDDLKATLKLVGENVVKMCNYSPTECKKDQLTKSNNIFAQTMKLVEAAKAKNPNISSKDIQEVFYNSPLMKRIITANVGMTVRDELKVALKTMDDGSGVLQKEINRITSPAIFDRIMKTKEGEELSRMLLIEVKKGNIEKAASSPQVRRLLSKAIARDNGNDGFVDRLMYGVVQPQIVKQKGSFVGVLGRAFGVVKGENFDWAKVRNTPEGQEARFIFSELIQGGITGDILMTNARGQKTTAVASREERISSLIEQAIKRL